MRIARGKTALMAGLFLGVAGSLQAEPPPVPAAVEAPLPRVSPSPGVPGPGTGLPVLPPPGPLPSEALPLGGDAHAGEPAPYRASRGTHWKGGLAAPPLGYIIGLHFRTQVENGVAARMTLYDYDFLCGTEQLNLRGKDRLFQIALLLGHNTHPLVIERTPHAPGLAEARRLAVLLALNQCPVPVPPERVVIGHPLAVPLPGWEAVFIYQNLESRTLSGGAGGAGGGRTTTTQAVGASSTTTSGR